MFLHAVELALSILKSDIGTCTFNLIKIGSCNSKSSIVLMNEAKELHTGLYSGAVSSKSSSIISQYLLI